MDTISPLGKQGCRTGVESRSPSTDVARVGVQACISQSDNMTVHDITRK